MSERDDDSDAPEEFTSELGMKQDEEVRLVQSLNKARFIFFKLNLGSKRAEVLKKSSKGLLGKAKNARGGGLKGVDDAHQKVMKVLNMKQNQNKSSVRNDIHGMLPTDIVNLLASHEKPEPVILKDIPPAQCLQNSLDFLKRRKMRVSHLQF